MKKINQFIKLFFIRIIGVITAISLLYSCGVAGDPEKPGQQTIPSILEENHQEIKNQYEKSKYFQPFDTFDHP